MILEKKKNAKNRIMQKKSKKSENENDCENEKKDENNYYRKTKKFREKREKY